VLAAERGHLHNVPGRKTDVADAAWIAQLVEHGLVRPSVEVAPADPGAAGADSVSQDPDPRARPSGPAARTRSWEDAGIKLSSVATDVLGVSGRAMLAALVAGSHDPAVLAGLAKGRLRAKLPTLREALAGRFRTDQHGLLVAQILAHIGYLDEAIALLSERIEQLIAPFAEQVALLDTIPGIDRRAAEVIVAELGPDMDQFPTAAHLASWAGGALATTSRPASTARAGPARAPEWLGGCLSEVAKAASRTKGTYLNAQDHRLRGRRGPGKATMAVAHSVLVIADHVLDQAWPTRSWARTTSSSATPSNAISGSWSASSSGSATRSPSNPSSWPDHATRAAPGLTAFSTQDGVCLRQLHRE
jgi:transposase